MNEDEDEDEDEENSSSAALDRAITGDAMAERESEEFLRKCSRRGTPGWFLGGKKRKESEVR